MKSNLLICLFIAIMTFMPVFSIESSISNDDKNRTAITIDALNGGWFEERDGVAILHVSGSNYDMGYQHGFLLRNETKENLRAMLNGRSSSDFMDMWNSTKQYTPEEYIDELRGMADGAGIPFEDVIAAYMSVITWGMGCFGIAAWGNATKNGELYHFRSFDLPMDIQDPITGKYMHENAILIARKPQNGYASISPSVAGSLHGGGGFNEKGIAVGIHTSWTNDITFHGTPATFRVQMTLDHATNADEAITYLTRNGTAGWNFIVSDCNALTGYAIETTANHSYVGTYNNPVESIEPFWSVPNVVRRTNFFISPEIAATQRAHYDPSGIKGFIRIFTENEPFFVIWKSYKAMSEIIEENYGTFDLNSSMTLFQKGYRGDTDATLKILIKLADGTSFNRAWNMWVANQKTGDFTVAFATRDNSAQYNKVHHFNFYDILEVQPPP